MRRIERTGQFRRDYRRVRRGRNRAALDTIFVEVLESLVNDLPLDPRHRTIYWRGNGMTIGIATSGLI